MSTNADIRGALNALLLAGQSHEFAVATGRSDYDAGRGAGFDTVNFLVRVYLGESTEANEAALDAMMDADTPTSIKQMIENDEGLSALTADVLVARCSGSQLFGEEKTLGAEWTVQVKKG